MKILITIPAFNPPHGGLRVIVEWANRLSHWHEVTLYSLKVGLPNWIKINPKVKIVFNANDMAKSDCLIITSPHSIHLQNHPHCPKKVFIFMQMVEHLFRPTDIEWNKRCKEFYTSPHPLIAISKWNIDIIQKDFGRTGPVHYVGNGVNLNDFPINPVPKEGKTILVEGWEGYNPAKDIENIGPRVAARLKAEGYTILAYGQTPIKTMPEACDKYFLLPDLKTINYLYEKATILIKASRYDARACAPVECMTKGTVTARAIIAGDDDLRHGWNSLVCKYDQQALYFNCKELLTNNSHRNYLAANCLTHVQSYSWDYWMEKINNILCND